VGGGGGELLGVVDGLDEVVVVDVDVSFFFSLSLSFSRIS